MDRLNQIVLLLVIGAGAFLAWNEISDMVERPPAVSPAAPAEPKGPSPDVVIPKPTPEPTKPVKKVVKIKTRQDFLKWLAKKNTFFVWSAKWCAACSQKDELGWWTRLQRDNQKIQVVYCDFDSLRNEASQKGIRVLPSVMMNNKKAAMESHVTYSMLLDWSRRHLQ